jgi:hypothetical protein
MRLSTLLTTPVEESAAEALAVVADPLSDGAMWTAATILDLARDWETGIACLLVALTNDWPKEAHWKGLQLEGVNTAVVQFRGLRRIDGAGSDDEPWLTSGASVRTTPAGLDFRADDLIAAARLSIVSEAATYVFGAVDETGWTGPDGWAPGQHWQSEMHVVGWVDLGAAGIDSVGSATTPT